MILALGQPAYLLLAATTFAFIATAIVRVIALRHRSRWQRTRLLASFAVALVGVFALDGATGLRWNATQSMPVGIYRSVAATTIARGMIVAACVPPSAARLGESRDYLAHGICPDGAEPVIKTVVATAGDIVAVTRSGVYVNGRRLPNSAPLFRDSDGRQMQPAFGRLRMARGTFWLYADHPRSWDSRYWGAVPARNVLARLLPVVTLRISSAP